MKHKARSGQAGCVLGESAFKDACRGMTRATVHADHALVDTTAGFLLGGRVGYVQPASGYRTGLEPVLLAASIPAQAGMRVLEAGLGAGAGLLCLTARVPDVCAVGVEIDPDIANLARRNLGEGATVVATDIATLQDVPPFDHAYANPPWHEPAATPSPDLRKRGAKQAGDGTTAAWIGHLARRVKPSGTVTVLVPARQAAGAWLALAAFGCEALTLFPLWPKQGRDAKLVLVRGTKGSRAPNRIAAGLVLHEADGAFTPAAQAILRDGAPLTV